MMRPRLLLIVAGVAVLGFAPAPLPKNQRHPREDLTDVAGLWDVVVWEDFGNRDHHSESTLRVRMTKDKFAFVMKAREGEDAWGMEMRLEPSAHPPAFTWGRRGLVRFVGSYRLHRDELTLILANGSDLANRPTDFAGKHQLRFVLRRIRRD
jgi:uncharacterized protein (TIGR03067 family)